MKRLYLVCTSDYDHSPLFVTDDKVLATLIQHKIYHGYKPVELPFLSSAGWYRESASATATINNEVDKDFEVVDDNE